MLIPAEELGFTILEFGIKEARSTPGELSRTVRKNLVIRLQKEGHEIDLSMSIPKLIDDNYVIINGRKKIPLFQLFDIPVVTRGKNVKLRTNVMTMVVSENKEPPFIYLTYLGKRFPFVSLLAAYYGFEQLDEMFGLSKLKIEDIKLNNAFEKLLFDLKSDFDESEGWTREDFISSLGKYFTNYDAKTKGEDAVYSIDLVMKTDIFSTKFLKTGSILTELIEGLRNPNLYDDMDFRNKRIRCFEYVILGHVSKVIFDFCMANRTARNPKFNVNSTKILSDCNVSDIVQFDFSINPVEELTKLSRTSLVGPGGFNRENIPKHLRDISPTMFGRLCPVDTPDRDNCGVLQSLIVNTKFDENLKFTDEYLDKQIISIPVSFVPFLEHDDQTRLQMASSQMRQAIMLLDFDKALIQTGTESLYTTKSQFVKIAKKNGEVLYIDHNYIFVAYNDNTTDIFEIGYRKVYVENLDFMKVYVKQGDKFKAGDILAESNFCTDGKINIGRNLLTTIMTYYGHNYEDGIVISDRLVNDGLFTSLHYTDLSFNLPPNKVLLSLSKDKYKPLPEPNPKTNYIERVDCGTPYAILKEMPEGPIDYYSIFEEEIPLLAKKDTVVTDVHIYANKWNTGIPEFNKWIEEKIETQRAEEKVLQDIIQQYLPREEALQYIKDKNLDKFQNVGKFKNKGEYINGIYVEMFGIYTRKIRVGDKIGNRHGNKGTISKIIPHEMMPMLEDGRHADICINPLGIISRMNVGQLFELHLAMSLVDLKTNLKTMLKDKVSQTKLKKYLLDYIKLIDNTKDNWYFNQFKEQLKTIDEKFIDSLAVLQPPFESVTKEMVEAAMKYTNTPFTYEIYDPISREKILNKVACGYTYFFRMVHIAESKLAARGIGSYARRTMQPLGGRKNRGGQRCGEMETACLIAHDAGVNLHEFMTTKSDCIDLKNSYIRDEIEAEHIKDIENEDIVPESVRLLDDYLTVIGVQK